MKIKNIDIENITVFEKLNIDISQGINIIIGENGTGKTHLLKFIYGLCEVEKGKNNINFSIDRMYFKTDYTSLLRSKSIENANVKIEYMDSQDSNFIIGQYKGTRFGGCGVVRNGENPYARSIFIPAKEMISHSKGFLALNNKYDMPFDKTYIDIITNAELPETREVSPINQKILDIISKVIDGTVVYENDTFYIVKHNGNKVEFSLEAEGLRKFGLLWKLIRNGLIEKDTILLWDEPEANINPELVPVIVDILLELQREGVQIFIATHSYNLAKYFEIKRKENDKVLFHSLYKTENGVKAQSNEYFGELDNNSIIEADSKLLDEVIEESLED